MGELRDRMEMAMQLRNFSGKTIRSYIWQAKAFTRMFGRSPAEMGKREVQQYIESLVQKKKSWSAIRLAYSALRFLYKETLEREWDVADLPPVKREKRLPEVMSLEEVQQIFAACGNVKHRTLLMTIYSCGLRVSEAVRLKITDIDSKRMVVRIEQGKGKKDRYTILSRAVLDQLRSYWRICRPREWLFPGSTFNVPLSVRAAQTIFANAKTKASITKPVSVHTLRHSFATHLLEGGTDIFVIKQLLGHRNLKTTSIYLHLQNASIEKIVHPLDRQPGARS